MRHLVLIGLAALAVVAAAAGFSPARAQSPNGNHLIVRCPRDGDTCVRFRCDFVGQECVRLDSIVHSRFDGWRVGGWRPDGKWAWYGSALVNCDLDGSHCVLLHR
jgi:hypothetical protein